MQTPLHPIHAVLVAGTIPLFLGVLFSDIAYVQTYEVQWKNFASWLIVGGLFFGGFALLWALIGFFRARVRDIRRAILVFLLLAIFVLGFINALVHAGDAWASMPSGLVLSVIVAALALLATASGFSGTQPGAVR